ncbi:MAG TPA: ABC transporter permease [Candidatus Polarisedimenticolia bacterium]|nr:ABC transporter permease [Candidatus Polarisedimenticolia bacterium]
MGGFLRDLRFGIRLLLKSPGYAAAAIATLAIGIGATTAIASVIGSVLLRPYPYPHAERVAMVFDSKPSRGWDKFAISPGNYLGYESGNHSFEAIAAFSENPVVLTGAGEPETITALAGTPQLAEIVGAVPARGRGFTEAELAVGGPRVAILTDALWQRRFGGQPETLGEAITLDAEPTTVVGILPPGVTLPAEAQILTPLSFDAEMREVHGGHFLLAMGRLKPGVAVTAAEVDLKTVAARMEKEFPNSNTGWTARVVSLEDQVVGNVRPALYALAGAVGCLLLLACANVANLILARSASRRSEMALRAALGAGSGRILRQLLTESLLLALAGGAAGALLGWWGVDLIRIFRPANLPRVDGLVVDGRVLLLAFTVSVVSGILFGTLPGLLLSRTRLQGALAEGGRGGRGRMSQRVRSTLVSAQVALALVLLIGTGLQVRSLARLLQVDPGYDPRNVLELEVTLPERRYPDPTSQIAFYDRVLDGMRALPGLRDAAITAAVPAGDTDIIWSFEIEGKPLTPDQSVSANWYAVSPDFFATMGVPILAGRAFDAHDREGSERVLIVNDVLAKRMFPGEDPIGKRILISRERNVPRTIVGVVGSTRHYGLDSELTMQFYDPVAQAPIDNLAFVIRTHTDPEGIAGAARGVIQSVDPEMAVANVRTLEYLLDASTAQRRFSLALLGVFAVAALVLAAVGVYGVVAYGVSQRTHEIGVRMALGAERRAILGLVLRQGMVMTLAGVGVGLLGALALTRVLQGMLFNVGAADPATYAATAAVMAVVAFVATYVPARRATRVEPTTALRCE